MADPKTPVPAPTQRDTATVVNEFGERFEIPRSELPKWTGGAEPEYREEGIEEQNQAYLKHEYGDQEGQAFLQGAAKVATFGGSDILLNELDPEGAKYIPEFSPNAYLGGELAMGVAGSGVGLGGAVTRGAGAVERAIAGEAPGVLTRIGAKAGAGAFEGGMYGLGEGVSQVAKTEGPVTAEGALATIGSNVLGGAVVGGLAGGAGQVLSETNTAVKGYRAKQMATAAEKAENKLAKNLADEGVEREAYSKVAHLDETGTKNYITEAEEGIKARKAADIAENEAQQRAERQLIQDEKARRMEKLYDDAKTWQDKRVEEFIQVEDSSIAAHMGGARKKIQRGLDDRNEFLTKEGVGKFQKGLAEEETALGRILQGSDEILETAAERQQKLYDGLPKPTGEAAPLMQGPFPRGPGGKVPKEAKIALTAEEAAAYHEWANPNMKRPKTSKPLYVTDQELAAFTRAVELGEAVPFEVSVVNKAMKQLEDNQAMQRAFREAQADIESPMLDHLVTKGKQIAGDTTPTPELKAAKMHLAELQKDTLGKKVMRGLGGSMGASLGGAIGGVPGALVGAQIGQDLGMSAHRLVRKLGSSNKARQDGIRRTISGMFEKGAKATAKHLPKASLVLDGVRYSSEDYVNATMGPPNYRKSKDPATNAFHERKRELDSITERTPGGGFQMRMFAMEEMGERVAAIWQIAPQIANAIEKSQQQKVAYLAEKCPRDPTPEHLQVGPQTWEPSKAEVAKFARIMEVAEDPSKAVSRIADGTATPDDVDTLKNVWPGHYDDIRQQCLNHMGQLQATLPYQHRLSLSILFEIPVDPALTPETLGVFQRKVAGKEGGGQAPAPQQNKPLPTGMIQPTNSQRMSAK